MGKSPRPLQPGPGRPRLSPPEEDEDAYDSLLDFHSDALAILLALPAPDLPALAAKLDVIVPNLAWELTGCEDCLEGLREDAHGFSLS